jgi:hypothetical protein
MGFQGAISPLTGQQTSSNEATKAETAATSARQKLASPSHRATHLVYNRHAHWWTFEEIVATKIRARETSNWLQEDNERLGLNSRRHH